MNSPITEQQLVDRLNAELKARGDSRTLVADRSTKLGDFILAGGGSPRLWLRESDVEYLARRNGLLAHGQAVAFESQPKHGRAYAPT